MIEKGNEIVRAPYLKAGDQVALVSPAYWVPEEVILQAMSRSQSGCGISATALTSCFDKVDNPVPRSLR